MAQKKQPKCTLREHFAMILRGYRLYQSFPQPVLLAKTISSVFDAVYPFANIYFSAQIINELAGARDSRRLLTLVLITIGVNLVLLLCKNLLQRWSNLCSTNRWVFTQKIYADKLLSMDYVDIEDPKTQELFSKIRQNENGMGFGLATLLGEYSRMVMGVVQIGLSVAMAFSLFTGRVPAGSELAALNSPPAALAVIALLLGSILLSPYFSYKSENVWAKASESHNTANRMFGFFYFKMLSELGRAKDIRLYDQQRSVEGLLNVFAKDSMNTFFKISLASGKFNMAATAVSYLCSGLIYLFVALKAYGGAFGAGSIVQYVGAITQFSAGFAALLGVMSRLFINNDFLARIFELLDTPNRKYQGSLSVEKRADNEYEIEFHHVSFKYPGSESYALRDLNMKLHIGERMAVVGRNGSGKTTMIKLLCRLYDPAEGVITLNGIDIRKYNYDEYMAIFSVVFQDFNLLSFPLGQNVACAVEYDAAKAESCLRKSGFGERLDTLKDGLSTCLYKNFEEDGVEVSGGEAQKIALARALYKDAPFIVLDEPTAALDPLAEQEIYSRFNDIVGEKTAVYISHRLSSCRFCNDIAVFEQGRMIQRGCHDSLLVEAGGTYAELWYAQAQYYRKSEKIL